VTEDEPGFAALAARIGGDMGMEVSAYKDRCLRRRIAVRMRACGVHTYQEYLAVLDREPAEFQRLLDALTINVTKFFRNRDTWEVLAAQVLPEMLRNREGRIRIWSAGCSSGEEPHTLVILMAQVLERIARPSWLERIRIDATDIDRQSLERARAGQYHLKAFEEADPDVIRRYCRQIDADTVEVRADLRAQIDVKRHDLLRDAPLAAYDLICCRNVVIYFDRDTQERLMERFTDALVPGGVLVLGKVETIFGAARRRLDLFEPRERIYRKVA
jgi:chemotaxis methyl-accepting protein methylase